MYLNEKGTDFMTQYTILKRFNVILFRLSEHSGKTLDIAHTQEDSK